MKILYHPNRDDIHLTSVLAALSDPVRLEIVCNIARSGEQMCSSFHYPVAKSTLTHHIRTLREAGVLNVRVQGTQHMLTLRAEDLDERFPGVMDAVLRSAALTRPSN